MLYFNLVLFAPGHSDSWIIVICLTCSHGKLLVVILLFINIYIKTQLLSYLSNLSWVFFSNVIVVYLLSGNFFMKSLPPSIFTTYGSRSILSFFAENLDLCF